MGISHGLFGHGSALDPNDLKRRLDGVLIEGETPQLAKGDSRFLRLHSVPDHPRRHPVHHRQQGRHTSIPYKAITRFAVETAGTFDLDSELKIWVSGSSTPIAKTLKKGTDVRGIQRELATGVLR